MKDFALDEKGDIFIDKCDIVLVKDEEQEIQKIRQVLGTKLGEWEFDENEGIDFAAISQKQPDLQRICETITNALRSINENYVLQECSLRTEDHVLKIQLAAENGRQLELFV